jgi:putative membrane protein
MTSDGLLLMADWEGHMDFEGGWWIVMALGMLIFWALVIAGLVWLGRELIAQRQHPRGELDPLTILDRRLAEGALSPDEYRERREMLTRERGGDIAG